MQHDERFAHSRYTIRRKILTFTGASFHVYDPDGNLVFFTRQKAFRLKEDIRIYPDESKTEEILRLKARQIIDFSATYDVHDCLADEHVGSLRRRGLKSIVKDEWLLFDSNENQIGVICEESTGLAVLRRLHDVFALIFPQGYRVEIDGNTACTLLRNRNPFVQKTFVDFTADSDMRLDPRLGIAASLLLTAIEGRQSG